ncbi:hypothetical protein BD560DRAFT_459208 [Blakeslea trispora]|nr:hypothetical protein BD560DRAFT_459208 [Blakeslea trispora]
MSLKFLQEDGKGSAFDEYGNESVEMKVYNEQFPLEDITNYDTYMDLKPAERLEKMKISKAEIVADQGHVQRKYTRHSDEKKKEHFSHLVYNRGYKVPEVAKELKIPKCTAHCWFKKEEDAAQRRIQQPQLAQEEEKKKVGRPKILNEEHKRFLLQKYSKDPRATVNEAMESLTSQFEGPKIAKTAVHDFMGGISTHSKAKLLSDTIYDCCKQAIKEKNLSEMHIVLYYNNVLSLEKVAKVENQFVRKCFAQIKCPKDIVQLKKFVQDMPVIFSWRNSVLSSL